MHFYVRSMITDLFSILTRYPNARVNPWPAVQLGSKRANSLAFDPNLELEFRNQAAAMTDCLLLYKESAKFIIFPDTDDIIIPRLGRTYIEEFQKVTLPIELNSALHLRFWNFVNHTQPTSAPLPSYDPLLTSLANAPLINPDDLTQIQENFVRNMRSALSTYERLPEVSIYYPLIEQCYNRIFYNGEQHSKCKGPELCDLPQFPGVRCVNVKSEYETFDGYDRIFLHRLVDVRFEHSDLGCTM
ncbi:hypothetical protein Y032_0138g2077 [Ancylostoma ceylanicum]|uniref:Glycosyltransferase family 92 protein n=2 Tax=Ancylostoma ceylanicum TaxID=53326 RepID=A0A016T506_9BILA|nr:hypothetical protein Y032_0138g2077 [Ancylostoma ceylanicum]